MILFFRVSLENFCRKGAVLCYQTCMLPPLGEEINFIRLRTASQWGYLSENLVINLRLVAQIALRYLCELPRALIANLPPLAFPVFVLVLCLRMVNPKIKNQLVCLQQLSIFLIKSKVRR